MKLEWSRPESLFPPGEGNPLPRYLSLSAAGESVFYLGNNLSSVQSPARLESFLVVGTAGQRPWAQPKAAKAFMYPRGAVANDGALTIVWAEPRMPLPPNGTITYFPAMVVPPSSLWTARRSPAGEWSDPRLVLDGGVEWSKQYSDRLQSDSGRTTLVSARDLPGAGSGLNWVLVAPDRVSARPIPGPAGATQPTWDSGPHGSYVGFIAADMTATQDQNSVFITRSTDGGETWSSPKKVHAGLNAPAQYVRVRVSPTGVVHVMWMQAAQQGVVLRHIESADGGRTWSPPADLIVDNGSAPAQAEFDACGHLRVILSSNEEGPSALAEARWDGSWSKVTPLASGMFQRAYDVALTRGPGGALSLGFLAESGGSGPRPMWMQLK